MTTMSVADKFRLMQPHLSNSWLAQRMTPVFQKELNRLDQMYPSSRHFAHLYTSHYSKEALLLCLILDQTVDVDQLRKVNATLIDQIMEKSPENLARIAAQWKSFTDKFFIGRGRPVPEWTQYIEIQEVLGIFGTSSLHRFGRSLRQSGLRLLKKAMDLVSQRYPDWAWATQKHCYLTAALATEYFLPDRKVSCIPEM